MKNTVWYNAKVGESIFDVIMMAVDMANEMNKRVLVRFNDTNFQVKPGIDDNSAYTAILNRWSSQGSQLTENIAIFD